MCRLFGCRSRASSRVSHELFHGANALRVQSREHPDGWGLGWYENGAPRVVRSLTPAHGDTDFEKLSHPDWERVRGPLEERIAPGLRAELRGETDSERCFLLFLTRLRRLCEVEGADAASAASALTETVAAVREIADGRASERASPTFLATDGRLLLACRSGRTLFLSSPAPDASGSCEYVAVASEDPGEPPPGGKRAWRLLPEDSLVAVDPELRLRVTSLSPP